MIDYDSGYFHLSTDKSSYVMKLMPTGHLEHLYYGAFIGYSYEGIEYAVNPHDMWSSWNAVYSDNHPLLQMSNSMLEYSLPGKGDSRIPSAEIQYRDGCFVLDMVYESHEISRNFPHSRLPSPRMSSDSETLTITLKDKLEDIRIKLYYTVYPSKDVIVRSTEIVNDTKETIRIGKVSSLVLDLPDSDWKLLRLNGSWGHDKTAEVCDLPHGVVKAASRTGVSSCETDPSIILMRPATDASSGEAIAAVLMYSGNHQESVEHTPFDLLRLDMGINEEGFSYFLEGGKSFKTPNAVISWSGKGLESLSSQLIHFAEDNIMRTYWTGRPRWIQFNSWEALSFKFDENKVKSLMDEAASLGMELFVLDDGWFGKRDDNTTSIGDWFVYRSKIPSGIEGLVSYAHSIGLKFGLWIEPEMISMDSELFRKHPDWIVKCPGRSPSPAKNQFLLDLCCEEVRDYILESVSDVVSVGVDYVKWDMNRNMSDMYSTSLADQGMFFHSWILGYYDLIGRFADRFPKLFIESCASGGNRLDWGILPFSDGVWISDVTDPAERTIMQMGAGLLYPRQLLGSHVTGNPNLQTLRTYDLKTRFAIASMGMLGYEMDFSELSQEEKDEIKRQISFYKKERDLFQKGVVSEIPTHDPNIRHWIISRDDRMVVICYQDKIIVNSGRHECLRVPVSNDGIWRVSSLFGDDWCVEVSGSILRNMGVQLPAKYTARRICGQIRTMRDHSADLFMVCRA